MKALSLLLLTFLLSVAASASEAPASIAELFATPENLRLVRSAEKVDVCILKHVKPASRADGSVDWSTERYEETAFTPVPAEAATALRALLLSGKTYDWKAGTGGRRPQFYLRLRFHRGEDVLHVDFCFTCRVLNLTQHGKELGHASFSPNTDLFLQIFLQLFPEDEPLKNVAREVGLPL